MRYEIIRGRILKLYFMKLTDKQFNFAIYFLECLLGTVIGYQLYRLHPVAGAWCLISIILVLSPDKKDAMNLAMNRIKANIIGSIIGLIIFYIHPINLFMVTLGIVLTLSFCEIFHVQSASRTAMISVLIVTLHEPGLHLWDVAIERALGVVTGCSIGVVLTYVFHVILSYRRKRKQGSN